MLLSGQWLCQASHVSHLDLIRLVLSLLQPFHSSTFYHSNGLLALINHHCTFLHDIILLLLNVKQIKEVISNREETERRIARQYLNFKLKSHIMSLILTSLWNNYIRKKNKIPTKSWGCRFLLPSEGEGRFSILLVVVQRKKKKKDS